MSSLPPIVEAFDAHQRRSISVLSRVLKQLQVGISEADAAELCREEARSEGFTDWYHPPEVAFGGRTLDQKVWSRPSGSARLKAGDLAMIDIAPATDQAYGDIGATVFIGDGSGAAEPDLVSISRECVRGCIGYSNHLKTVGEIFIYARAWAVNNRLEFANRRSIGHRLIPLDEAPFGGGAKMAHGATWLRRHQVQMLNPNRLDGMWAYRPHLSDGRMGASFEEAIWINGEERKILGRDSLDEVGSF
jgi:Xaa-Pro aminopeptidase